MRKPLMGQKIAFLVANGFCEQDMTSAQRELLASGAHVRIISMDQGLVNSWNGEGWGLHFAADGVLSSALAADFDMLVIPGGRRSIEKLKLTAHTKRFIGGFTDTGKKLAVYGEALDLLIFADKIQGRTVSGPKTLKNAAVKAGAAWSEESFVDSNLLTGVSEESRENFTQAMKAHFISDIEIPRAAA